MITIDAVLTPYNRPSPINGRYAQLKHWSQTGLFLDYKDFRDFSYGDATGLPNVWKSVAETHDVKVPIDEDVQRHIFSILQRSTVGLTPTEHMAIWKNLMKGNIAFANGTGWDNGNADYIQGTNTDKEPIRLEQILIGGGTYLVTVEGAQYCKVAAWDLKKNKAAFLKSTPWNSPETWQPCVISRTQHTPAGVRYEEISPFPRTERIGANYIYMPTVAWDKDYLIVDTTSLRFMTDSEVKPGIPLLNWAGMKNRSVTKERIG